MKSRNSRLIGACDGAAHREERQEVPDQLGSQVHSSFINTCGLALRTRRYLVSPGRSVQFASRTALSVIAALLLPVAAVGQTPSPKACDLLTSVELVEVIGGSFGHASGKEVPYRTNPQLGIDHDGILHECAEIVGARKVTVRFSTSEVTAEARKKAEAVGKDGLAAMQKLGYQVQIKEVGGSHCTTLLPFAGAKGNELLPVGTTCVLEKGAHFVSIQVSGTSSGDVLPAERAAQLTEKAATRLPAR